MGGRVRTACVRAQSITVRAADLMDDGTPICVAVTIDARTRRAVFDFTGTGYEVFGARRWRARVACDGWLRCAAAGNTNAPPAVTYSAGEGPRARSIGVTTFTLDCAQ